jgi:hypothetical protein
MFGVYLLLKLDNVLVKLLPVGRNGIAYQQGVNGILPFVGISHFVKNLSSLVTLT